MATAVATPDLTRASHGREQHAYWTTSLAMAEAAGREDHDAVRRLLMRREHLLALLGTSDRRPSRALRAEVEALDARTMLALGVEPPRRPLRLARPCGLTINQSATRAAVGYGR